MKKNLLNLILLLLVTFPAALNAQQIKVGNMLQPYAVAQPATNYDFVVEFQNTSAINVTSVDFSLDFNGFNIGNTQWSGNVSPGGNSNLSLGQVLVITGQNNATVYVSSVNGSPYFDTINYKIIGNAAFPPLPYSDDFEGNVKWASSLGNQNTGRNNDAWQLTTPNNGNINTAYNGINSWVLGVDSDYHNNVTSYLYSPIFSFSSVPDPKLWYNINTDMGIGDYVELQYTTDFLSWSTKSGSTAAGSTGGWNVSFNSIIPISCAGSCDGLIDAFAINGQTYFWSNGTTTGINSNLCAGTYTVTVDDGSGCTSSSSYTLVDPSALTVNLGPDVSFCSGDSAVLCPIVSGGVPPYTYIWNTGAITSCITVTTSGSYSVTMVDVNGCSVTDVIVITVNPNPVINLGPDVFICDGASALLDAGPGFASYLWSTGEVTQTILVTSGGTYTVTVTNINGCTGSDDITVTQSSPIIVTPHEAFNCLTLTTDSIYVDVTGGTFPNYFYIWSNGNSTNVIYNPLPAVYSVTVSDLNGCTGSASLTVYGSLNLSLTKTDPECFGYPGTISAVLNGTPPFSYQWSNGATIQQPLNTFAGTYTVTVTDGNGCTLSATDSLVDPDPVVLTIDSVIASGCGASNGAFYYSFTPAGFSIPWINGVQFATSTNLPKGIYNIYIVQNVCASNTVTVVVPDSCADVWPGDANYDLVADNKDLLQIGLAYGNTGPVRPGASNTWVAQACPDWGSWFSIGVNQKHADCDGNGLIEVIDTIPILANYGLTHLLKPVIIPQVNTTSPDLYLTITQDTTGLSDTVFINVMCGTAANPVDSIYGLAFTLYYDSALVDTNSVFFNYSNSFLGTAGLNLISISKNFGVGYADFAITRTNHSNATGFGPVAVMGIVTTDNVAGKLLNAVNTTLQFSLSDVYAVTANEFPITLDVFGDSIYLDSNLTSINYLNWDKEVKVYPNPASNYFVVASSLTNISKISIMNQLGEIVYNNNKSLMPQNINVATIPNGVYVLRVETKDGIMHRKIQIIR